MNLISKWRKARIKRLSKEGFWFGAGQIASIVGSLFLVRILTEHLDPDQYGQLSLGLTIAGLVNTVVMGGITNGISRFYPIAVEKQDLYGYMYATRRLLLYATAVAVLINLLLIIALLWLGYSQLLALAALVFVFSLFSAYNAAVSAIQNAARQRSIVAFHVGLDAWLKIGLVLLVIYWFGNSSTSVVIGYTFSSFLIILSQIVFLRRTMLAQKQQSRTDYQWIKQMFSYSLPFATWGIFVWAQQSAARWALEVFTTTETVGLYFVLFQLGYAPIQILTSTGLAFLIPIIFARSGDGSSAIGKDNVRVLIKKIAFLGLWLTTIAVLLAAILHSYIFRLLVNDSFFSVSSFLPWVVLAGGIFSVAQLYASKAMALLKTKKIISAMIGSSIIGIAAAMVGTYYFSLIGAVFSMVIHSISYLIWIVIAARALDK
jgi:O-antigen/teichoic acid export membrane protein